MGSVTRASLERESRKRLRELERQAKESAKLSALEQARLEVETFQSRMDVLLSIHKQCSTPIDWGALSCALPPCAPFKRCYHEFRNALEDLTRPKIENGMGGGSLAREARAMDEDASQRNNDDFEREYASWKKEKELAARMLEKRSDAYSEALRDFSGLAEISDLGSELRFTVHTSDLVECHVKVNGTNAIPSEYKILSASGKVSVKPFPKTRFHEVYQDYVSGCVLRIAREVFAVLPIEHLLITALVEHLDTRTGKSSEQAILSVAFPRKCFAELEFETLDPSDSLDVFLHRGDFKASRKGGAFEPIIPLSAEQFYTIQTGPVDRLKACRDLRGEIRADLEVLQSKQLTVL